MEDRNSVIVLNPAITNNNNENEGLKRNHDVDVDDCPSPRKKANKKVSQWHLGVHDLTSNRK